MKFWVDAQLPPQLAAWLAAEFQVEASSLRDLGLRDAADLEIFQQAAMQPGIVLISKDSDFVDMVSRFGPPPQLLWVTCGNVTNRRLQTVFGSAGRAAINLLAEGQAIVEIC
jgi:predicted nuclease of predicted toxin-antitoxin system